MKIILGGDITRKRKLLDKQKEGKSLFIPFNKRKDCDWTDIKPLDQFSPKVEILKMDFDDKYREVSGYFRAILHKNEITPRAFDLTKEMIQLNSTNYMAWYHRRQCLDNLDCDLKKELNWLDEIGVANQKNYQIWHHRKVIIELLNDPSHEKPFLNKVFAEEPKNFHAWCHRIWVIRKFKLFDGELDYIEKMLDSDVRNNSVWNYRFFIFTYTNELNEKILSDEINYVFNKIKIVPNNESPYNYIRGFFNNNNLPVKFNLKEFPQIKKKLDEVIENSPDCAFAYSFLFEWYLSENDIKSCESTCDILGEKVDRIRNKYWMWKKLQLSKK